MGLRDGLTALFSPPTLEHYECTECGQAFGQGHEGCPNCGSGQVVETRQDDLVYYWGGM